MPLPTSTRVLYLWHLTSGLTHLLLESTYVYNCFTAYISIPIPPAPSSPESLHQHPPRYFLSHPDRLYGSAYSTNIFAPLWIHYAKADSRYSGIDLTTLSLEIITMALAGPLALYVALCVRRDGQRISPRTWFWAIVLASAELYGGLVNFLPEALSGCTSLDMGDAVRFWVYVVGFNVLWVVFPLWVLRRAWVGLTVVPGMGRDFKLKDR